MTPNPPLFSKEKEGSFKSSMKKIIYVQDSEYVVWLRPNHPDAEVSPSEISSLSSGKQGSINSSEVLAEVLVLPEPKAFSPKAPKKRQRVSSC